MNIHRFVEGVEFKGDPFLLVVLSGETEYRIQYIKGSLTRNSNKLLCQLMFMFLLDVFVIIGLGMDIILFTLCKIGLTCTGNFRFFKPHTFCWCESASFTIILGTCPCTSLIIQCCKMGLICVPTHS